MTTRNPLRLGRKAKPTLKHRPAVWECMLGTVYARSPQGEVRYFDYRWEQAVEFAELGEDLRTFRAPEAVRYYSNPGASIRRGQPVLWTL